MQEVWQIATDPSRLLNGIKPRERVGSGFKSSGPGTMAALVPPPPPQAPHGSLPPAAQTAIIDRPRGTTRGRVRPGFGDARDGQGRERAGESGPSWRR